MRSFDYRALDKRKATLEPEINRDPFFTLGKELEQAEKSTAKNTPGRPLRVEFRETNIVCSTYYNVNIKNSLISYKSSIWYSRMTYL